MKVQVQSVNFKADKSLIEFVEEKLNTLDRFYDKIVSAEVFLKVQQTSEKENKNVEARVGIPGNDIMVKRQAKTFEEGVLLTVDALKRQLRKSKEKSRGR